MKHNNWSEHKRKFDRCYFLTKDCRTSRDSHVRSLEQFLVKYFWGLRIKTRPPYFANPFLLALGIGTYLSIQLCVFRWQLSFFNEPFIKMKTLFYVGFSLGIMIAGFYWVEARLKKLPRWKDL